MPRGFDYETYVVLAREVYTGLDMLWFARVDNIDRISEVTTRILWVWQATVVIPVVVGIADGVVLVEDPRSGPELCHGSTGGVVVIWLAGMTDASWGNALNESARNCVVEGHPSRLGRPGRGSRNSFAFLGIGSCDDGRKERGQDEAFNKFNGQHCSGLRETELLNPTPHCLNKLN